jgi:FkbM family methyltransferase
MSWRTNDLVVMMRNVGRAVGLNKWIASWLLRGGYEIKYDQEFSACIRLGDCVWDVGANVGYYTRLFAKHVGDKGKVFAFEPSPVNFSLLAQRCTTLKNVTLIQCGLGESKGTRDFQQGEDALGATSRVTDSHSGGLVVEIYSGDHLLTDGKASAPQAIKIDVEGFEWEVLEGISGLLKQSCLQTIGIEVHFEILKERGMGQIPQQIEQLLCDAGFRIIWPDSSHVLAVRKA